MTTIIGTDLDRRCKSCGFDPDAMGHRSIANGIPTGCQDSGPLGLLLAEQRKSQAFDRLDRADSTDENALLRREIIRLGRRKLEFTADDLPASVRETTNANRRGRVFSALIDEGVIREIGRTKSLNPRAHGKKVGVYRLGVAA